MGKILIYYRYITIDNPPEVAEWQRTLCTSLNLLGRILVAPEGINGTVSGHPDTVQVYKTAMHQHPLFAGTAFKEEDGPQNCFPRLQVTVKPHIVNFGASANIAATGTHLPPAQAHELMQNPPDDLIIFDARNNYESRVGKFDGALTPDIENFRDLPAYFDAHAHDFKDKRVLMYCTGGIRCEIASAYLQQKGVAKEVMQLEGGIISYAQEFPDGFFRGKNYVFDGRVTVPITNDILTQCDLCTTSCDEYTHCLNAPCNKQIVACSGCIKQLQNCCSTACLELVTSGQTHKRPPFKKATSCTVTL